MGVIKFPQILQITTGLSIVLHGGHCGGHLGYWTKSILKLRPEFDKSNPFMKFGSNRVIND